MNMRKREIETREAMRERLGQSLEADLREIRIAWLKRDTDQKMRALLQELGTSAEWKEEMVAKLRAQGASGELDPLIAAEQIAFIQSLTVTE